MSYKVKIGKDINIQDVEDIFRAVGWGDLHSGERWLRVLQQSSFVVQVLDNGYTIGFARTVDDGDMCMVYDVSVHPDYQGKGVGNMLMNEIKKYIDSNDFIRVQLFSYDKTPWLKQFYEKFGFKSVSTGMSIK